MYASKHVKLKNFSISLVSNIKGRTFVFYGGKFSQWTDELVFLPEVYWDLPYNQLFVAMKTITIYKIITGMAELHM